MVLYYYDFGGFLFGVPCFGDSDMSSSFSYRFWAVGL